MGRFVDIEPSNDIEQFRRQFRALAIVADGLERMNSEANKNRRIDEAARKTLDSERAANAILTEENETLRCHIETLLDCAMTSNALLLELLKR